MHESFSHQCPFSKAKVHQSDAAHAENFTDMRFPDIDLQQKKAGFDGVQRLDIVPMAISDWFRFDTERVPLLHKKELVLDLAPSHAYLALPRSEPGARELLAKIRDWVCTYHPDSFESRGDSLFDRTTGTSHVINADSPLLTAAKIVSEDLVLLNRDDDGRYRLVAGCVCFPSNWSLGEKLNQTVSEIHSPVPELNQRIGAKIDAFMDRMKPDRPQTRSNFLINFDPELSQIPGVYVGKDAGRPELDKDTIGEVLWLRSERETFTKLPVTGNIVFTLRTYQTQLNQLSPATAKIIADLHRSVPDTYRKEYRKLSEPEHQLLLDYLDDRSKSITP